MQTRFGARGVPLRSGLEVMGVSRERGVKWFEMPNPHHLAPGLARALTLYLARSHEPHLGKSTRDSGLCSLGPSAAPGPLAHFLGPWCATVSCSAVFSLILGDLLPFLLCVLIHHTSGCWGSLGLFPSHLLFWAITSLHSFTYTHADASVFIFSSNSCQPDRSL